MNLFEEMYCPEKECIDEWNEMTNNGEDDDGEFIHCDIPHCHIQYWKHKNGTTCEDCDLQVCENCAMDDHAAFLYDDEFFCVDCLRFKVDAGDIGHCQNTRKLCKNFVYRKLKEVVFVCLNCDRSFCDDCRRSELVKNICRQCKRKNV